MRKKYFFLFSFQNFLGFWVKNFRLSAKKLQKVFKTTYVSRGIVCCLKLFSKVLNRFGFSAETLGMVLKNLSTCPEQKLRKQTVFFVFFPEFFRFLSKNFSDFRPKNFKKVFKSTFCASRGTFCDFNFI